MVSSIKSNTAYLLVGCGGSGAKAIAKLVDLMSNDPRWRHDLDQYVFILLIDTNEADLRKYSKQISMRGPDIMVRRMLLTNGFTRASDIVSQFKRGFERLKDSASRRKAVQRFSEHWWVQHPEAENFKDAKPFMMPDAKDVQQGAGQSPMISFIAAWQAMTNAKTGDSVQTILDMMIRDISKIKSPMSSHHTDLHDLKLEISFVGSVAGGTGRGCAIPIAFKFKEILHKRGQQTPFLRGFFFNEDVFRSIDKNDRKKQLAKAFNAMTGWSELDTWMQLGEEGKNQSSEQKDLCFFLPSPLNMADERFDYVSMNFGVDGTHEAIRAFDQVGIICATGTATHTIESDQAMYEMVAAGLYADFTNREITGSDNNDHDVYFSIGSSTVEIAKTELDAYFKNLAKLRKCEDLRATLRDTEKENIAKEFIKNYLGITQHAIDNEVTKYRGDDGTRTKEEFRAGTILQRYAVKVSESGVFSQLTGGFREALDDDDLAKVLERWRGMFEDKEKLLPALKKTALDCYLQAVCEFINAADTTQPRLDIASPEKLSSALVERAFFDGRASDGGSIYEQANRSVAAVEQVARSVLDHLQEAMKPKAGKGNAGYLLRDINMLMPDATQIGEKIKKASRKENIFYGDRFNQREQSDLNRFVHTYLMSLSVVALGEELSRRDPNGKKHGFLVDIVGELERISGNSKALKDALDEIVYEEGLVEESLEEKAKSIFANPAKLEASLGNHGHSEVGYFIKRTIKPLRPDESTLKPVNEQLDEYIQNGIKGSKIGQSAPGRPSHKLCQELRSRLQPTKMLTRPVGGGSEDDRGKIGSWIDVKERFKLQNVLKELKQPWEDYLANLAVSDEDEYRRIEQQFSTFFGLGAEYKAGRVKIGGRDEFGVMDAAPNDPLLLGLTMITARTCRAYWKTEIGVDKKGGTPSFVVMVPSGLDTDQQGKWTAVIQRGCKAGNEETKVALYAADDRQFRHGEPDGSRFNEYALVVYCSERTKDLTDVKSLEWQRDELIEALRKAENTEVLMPFQPAENFWPGYTMSGFSSPFYIKNGKAQEKRWKPWLDVTAGEKAENDEVSVAISYALLGPDWFIRQLDGLTGQGRFFASAEQLRKAKGARTKGSGKGADKAGAILDVGQRDRKVVLRRRPVSFPEQVSAGRTGRADKVDHLNFVVAPSPGYESHVPEGGEVAKDLATLIAKMRSTNDSKLMNLREAILREYRDFMKHISWERRFSPKHEQDSGRYAVLCKAWSDECESKMKKLSKNKEEMKFWQEVAAAVSRMSNPEA